MKVNYLIFFGTALIPLLVGFFWYGKALFGNAWMAATGLTEEKAQSGNMLLIFGLTYLFGLFLSFAMMQWGVHQYATQGLFATQAGFAEGSGEFFNYYQDFLTKYGHLHRSFGHGAVHGGFAAVFLALPFIAINALFERRSWKYIMIHFGYWFITLVLISGTVNQFA